MLESLELKLKVVVSFTTWVLEIILVPWKSSKVLLTDLPPAPQLIYCVGVGHECDRACPGTQEITSGSWISLPPSITFVVEIELWSSDLAANTFTHQTIWLAP